ncbi:MAG: aromatic-ring-hydroxylating dioxygenase subunit beta [Alteraurantiacibacter sp. bin_em_oilr2.035]|uniref:aromatic-ring-hydroxylating dioxygenase subunit beta n=1 Tax=Aurantiacibacter atlanticus TaxID=1648404 RepID=UPI000662B7F2|nr:aromatic-ring-hydroxylating dioxygenase subunit beta [Aurantiacibacter atlanticus]MDF1835768.1 aromatic-ring-hydroxylating dioxygenase subunit beta [Alteraurantiacibacter sp. bin_em_oilr2.035]
MNTAVQPRPAVSESDQKEIEAFLARESMYADESRYSDWESLVDDDMVYWVPTLDGARYEPGEKISIIFDNRSRVATRIRQLNTGTRHSQVPVSPMVRVQSNFLIEQIGEEEFSVKCNQVLHEYRIQSTRDLYTWPARVEYKLRRKPDGFRMYFKGVYLIAGSDALPGLPFII